MERELNGGRSYSMAKEFAMAQPSSNFRVIIPVSRGGRSSSAQHEPGNAAAVQANGSQGLPQLVIHQQPPSQMAQLQQAQLRQTTNHLRLPSFPVVEDAIRNLPLPNPRTGVPTMRGEVYERLGELCARLANPAADYYKALTELDETLHQYTYCEQRNELPHHDPEGYVIHAKSLIRQARLGY